eukprot:15297131-Alexandrium_andersonii.AAC.1
MESWGVWGVRPISECLSRAGKNPVGGRWVDHNKGDAESPNVRSRYVAKDIAYYKDLLSDLATRRRGRVYGRR